MIRYCRLFNTFRAFSFKGYLCYKSINSQNVSSEAKDNNFYFIEKLCSVLKIFKHLHCLKSVMSWVLVHETGCIFEYISSTTFHWVAKLGQMIDVNRGNNFQKSFEQFGGLGNLQPGEPATLATCSNNSITNYVKIHLCHFLKEWIREI